MNKNKWLILSLIVVATTILVAVSGCVPNGNNGPPPYKVGPKRLFFCVPAEADSLQIRTFAATADFARIKAVGATIIHSYGMVWLPDQGQEFLVRAHRNDLRVLYCIKGLIHDYIRAGKPWDKWGCETIVEKFDDHPALWGWYVLDEPDAGIDHPEAEVSMELQKEIHDTFRLWTNKLLVIALRGGTKGWHLIDFSLWKIISDSYVFDGTGECRGMKPLDYLDMVGQQEWNFMQEHEVDFLMFIYQCDSSPATGAGNYETKVPLGQIKNQFQVMNKYELFPEGIAVYAWDGGDFCPNWDGEIYNEIKIFFSELEDENG